jgi:hypothetical protein
VELLGDASQHWETLPAVEEAKDQVHAVPIYMIECCLIDSYMGLYLWSCSYHFIIFIACYSPYLRSIRVYSLGLNLVQFSFLIVHLLSWLRIWFLSEFFDKFNKGINYLGFHFA